MKYFLWVLLVLVMFFSSISTWIAYYEKAKFGEVKEYDFNLEIEKSNGKLKATWDKYEGNEELKWYKFIYSTTNSNLSYPEDTSEYIWNKASITSHLQYLEYWSYYVRLCVITKKYNRYCSKVKKFTLEESRNYKEEYKNYKEESKNYKEKSELYKKKSISYKEKGENYKKESEYYKEKSISYKEKGENYKKENTSYKYNTWESTYVETYNLSQERKVQIRDLVGNFIIRLENRNYSDKQIIAIIEKVNKRVIELKSNEQTKILAMYVIIVLDEYKAKYESDLYQLESIFNIY